MAGSRPLSDAEDAAIFANYTGCSATRDRCMHELCSKAGLRIAEACSLRVCDVVRNSEVVKQLYLHPKNAKGKKRGAYLELHLDVRLAIWEQVKWLRENGYAWPDAFLLMSRTGTNKPLTRRGAHDRLLAAAARANVPVERIGTHTLRKTFARRVEAWAIESVRNGAILHPYEFLRVMLRHRCIKSTMQYTEEMSSYITEAIHSQPSRER